VSPELVGGGFAGIAIGIVFKGLFGTIGIGDTGDFHNAVADQESVGVGGACINNRGQ